MWLRVVALLFTVVFAMGLPAQAVETGTRRADGPLADPTDSRRPAEAPPSDFSGHQYIDSAGCVFLRTDAGWRARLAHDGTLICGWPPTLAVRPGREMPSDVEPRAVQIERILTETIITNMQEGELAVPAARDGAGQRGAFGPQKTGETESNAVRSADSDPLNVGRMLAHAPDLRRQLVGTGRAERLCELVGAGDPLGLCGRAEGGLKLAGGRLGSPVLSVAPPARAKVAAADPVPQKAAAENPPLAAATQPVAPAAAVEAARLPRPKVASPPQPTVMLKETGSSSGASRPEQLLVPPGARYVEVGAFTAPDQARSTAARLVGMGLPVVRSKPRKDAAIAIMVGPLEGREAIVRMADRLRRAGFTRLVARR